MKNTFGNSLTLTLFGESHGEYIGAVLDGLAPGIKIDREYINARLGERRPQGKISTPRVEKDEYIFASGEFCGYTTGSPLTILIPNENKQSKDYSALKDTPRPSHADYTAECKYHGFQDYRGGGHFSGRVTAALVAAGAIVRSALLEKGIKIGSHIIELHGASDRRFEDFEKEIDALVGRSFPTLSESAEEIMRREIEKAAAAKDSVGGILETAVIGIPAGVGEPWFDTLESMISHAVFSVPAVKGIEFGAGFAFADMLGSEANDPFYVKDGKVLCETNNNGGINGGISNGMPIVFNTVVKPTPSIFKLQNTVSLEKMCNTTLELEGRHDPAIIHRARAVIDAVAALVIADMLTVRFGTDYLKSEK
jgi:chorismate synthase